ncbi:MAG TPA: dihydropteroate synthase [Ferruginibacter sp.]|nr:dihydropteroate synthase [Ferruginibacter sp.]
MYSINCRGTLLSMDAPLVMGIINATPDSFYEGHLDAGTDAIVRIAGKMMSEGADILDVGGLSTRPGSKPVAVEEETARVVPVIKGILEKYPAAILSVDTYHSAVAEAALQAGAVIVNDISGGELDSNMLATVARWQVPYICMHMKGTPATMQQDPQYEDVVKEVLDYFITKTEACRRHGIKDVIIDPGFGFGKTIQHNFRLLEQLEVFSILNMPLLAGLSRKSSIYKTLGVSAAEALNGTTVLNTIALMHGASILRVHDVKEAKEAVTLFTAYKKAAR